MGKKQQNKQILSIPSNKTITQVSVRLKPPAVFSQVLMQQLKADLDESRCKLEYKSMSVDVILFTMESWKLCVASNFLLIDFNLKVLVIFSFISFVFAFWSQSCLQGSSPVSILHATRFNSLINKLLATASFSTTTPTSLSDLQPESLLCKQTEIQKQKRTNTQDRSGRIFPSPASY